MKYNTAKDVFAVVAACPMGLIFALIVLFMPPLFGWIALIVVVYIAWHIGKIFDWLVSRCYALLK